MYVDERQVARETTPLCDESRARSRLRTPPIPPEIAGDLIVSVRNKPPGENLKNF